MSEARIKDYVRKRDGNRCIQCGMTSQQSVDEYGVDLDVHRMIPRSAYTVHGCMTLCKACHATKPKTRGRNGNAYRFDVELDLAYGTLLDAFCQRHQRSLDDVLIEALREFLDRYGHLPAYRALAESQLWPAPPPDLPQPWALEAIAQFEESGSPEILESSE